MKCKYCDMDNIAWPENYVKGDKPIETETGTTHDRKRCESIKDTNTPKKWHTLFCIKCGNKCQRNSKYFTVSPLNATHYVCSECDIHKYNCGID